MKIQLACDLDLELLVCWSNGSLRCEALIRRQGWADVLVLAGDIHSGTKAVDVFGDWPAPVLYVAGNPEFYSERCEPIRVAIREAAAGMTSGIAPEPTSIARGDCRPRQP